MKAIRLGELRELIQSQPFASWWADYQEAVTAAREARLHHDDLVAQAQMMELRAELAQRAAVDVVTTAGEAQEAAARTATEAQALEDEALALAGAEDARRSRPLAEVEATWEKSLAKSLGAVEAALRARRVRQDAERLFKEAEERRTRARQLRADADAAGRARAAAEERRATLLSLAGERFGCTPGESFLYWRHDGDHRSAFAVSLVDDAEGYNVPVTPLTIHGVARPRGVAFLEPARASSGG